MDDFTKAQSMIELFNSYIPTRVIYVAAKLGLADHIGDDGALAQDLAEELNVHPDALYRLMRVKRAFSNEDSTDTIRSERDRRGACIGSNKAVQSFTLYSP